MKIIPDLPRGTGTQDEAPLATAQWLLPSDVIDAFGHDPNEPSTQPILIGELHDERGRHFIEIDDNRHLVTVAGSRAGKGVSLILPNLLNYPGSIVCIDPKGENAAVTARWRSEQLGQEIVVLDPFEVAKVDDWHRRSFNPLPWIDPDDPEALDDVAGLADAIVMKGNSKDPHWDESARAFLKGVMLLMLAWLPPEDRSLPALRQLVMLGVPDDNGVDSFDELLDMMQRTDAFNGAIASAGAIVARMGDNERGSVLSTVARHTEFLESSPIVECMTGSSFDPSVLKTGRMTIYLVLPEWRLGTHSRWLRLMVNSLLISLQRTAMPPKGTPPVLFILDEMATLGHMESIERAAGYIAGFGVKLWSILQDLSQLKDIYQRRWETFLGNAGVLTAFGNTDTTTLEYLSKRLGDTEVIRTIESRNEQEGISESRPGIGAIVSAITNRKVALGAMLPQGNSTNSGVAVTATPGIHRTPLLNPDEVARYFSREQETSLVFVAGLQPMILNRIIYWEDPYFIPRVQLNPYHRE